MRAAAVISSAVGATLIALVTPLDDHSPSAPRADDVSRMETLIAARLATGLWAQGLPPGLPPEYPTLAPDRARPLDRYVRYYTVVTLSSEEDLPFTTIDSSWDAAGFAGRRIVGVLALPDIVQRPAGIVINRTGQLPQIVHGGCSTVNVVYDPEAGRLVSAWCNVPTI